MSYSSSFTGCFRMKVGSLCHRPPNMGDKRDKRVRLDIRTLGATVKVFMN